MLEQNIFKKLIILFVVIFPFAYLITFSATANNSDAIAMRVIPNPEHYSASSWFLKQGFSGPKQNLVVDGFEAVRSNNTVYANVGNVVDTDGDGTMDELYTNIYLISFNVNSDDETGLIFSQILKNWKFNTNIVNSGNCQNNASDICTYDIECDQDDYCQSEKSKIIRDVKRLADAAEIKSKLEKYKETNGYYPILSAGSYLPNISLSAWPSWEQTLSNELNYKLPLDPLNFLGACSGYNPKTCWNSDSNDFATDIFGGILPPNSFVYLYRTDSIGSFYSFCFTSDTSLISEGGADCLGSISYTAEAGNNQPYFSGVNLPQAFSGEPFIGFLEGKDDDNDSLTWSIDTTMTTWNMWSSPVNLDDTPVFSQKKISSLVAGASGTYNFSVSIDDGRGMANSARNSFYSINVINPPPDISFLNITYIASSTNPFVFNLSSTDTPSNYPFTYALITPILPGTTESFNPATGDFTMSGIVSTSQSIPSTTNYNFTINISDSYGATASDIFTIKIINNPPTFTNACPTNVRINHTYSCDIDASDSENNNISYSINSLSQGTSVVNSSTGQISINSLNTPGILNFDISAKDEYSAETILPQTVSVNTYCGDGNVQPINMEGVLEQCDDGNTNNTDACDNNCNWTILGFASTYAGASIGTAANIVFDTNNSPTSAVDAAGGTNIKLSNSMPTPYIWVANSYTCDPSDCAGTKSNFNKISKIRLFDGFRVTSTGMTTIPESTGQFIGTYDTGPTGANPSRTAVNVETGDVWVANRSTGDVSELNIDGTLLKTCLTNPGGDTTGGPRGVVIEENGDVWVGNYTTMNIVKISGNNASCNLLENISLPVNVYGMAIDSNDNIWINGRPQKQILKFNIASHAIDTYNFTPVASTDCWGTSLPAYGPYGITVDTNDNVWIADVCAGVHKLDSLSGVMSYYSLGPFISSPATIAVTIDSNKGVWVSSPLSDEVIHIPDVNNPTIFSKISSNIGPMDGDYPRGIAGDSEGQVWSINYFGLPMDASPGSNITGFSFDNSKIGIYPVNPSIAPNKITAYTYSDMTGINRAMIFRSAKLILNYDSFSNDQHWGKILWDEIILSAKQSIDVQLRASNNAGFGATSLIDSTSWNALSDISSPRSGRYLQIEINLRSREEGVTPVLYNLSINGDLLL